MDAVQLSGAMLLLALVMRLKYEALPNAELVQREKRKIVDDAVLRQYVH